MQKIEIPVFYFDKKREFVIPDFAGMNHSDPNHCLLDGYEGNHSGHPVYEALEIQIEWVSNKKTTAV
jgi:hypothetical protein